VQTTGREKTGIVNMTKKTHTTKDGRTAKKGLYFYMNKAKKEGRSNPGKGTVTDEALTNAAKTAKPRKKMGDGGPADLNKDGKLSSYEKKRGDAIDRSMAKQNRVKVKNGGFIARGCGSVMNPRRKVTTIS